MNILLGIFAVFGFACVGTALYLVLGEDEGMVEAMIRDLKQSAAPRPSSNR